MISKDLETVKTLLEAGADPSPQSNRFWACLTPLHLALQTRQPEIARALLEAGADANVRGPSPDRWQPSPLAIANHWKAPGHFEALVQYGADMHTAEVVGWAMSAEDTKPLELLLGLGVNLKHPAWENALDVAMENGREQTAEMLRSQLIDSN